MQFLPGSGRIDIAVWMHYLVANKTGGEEARQDCCEQYRTSPGGNTNKAPTIRPPVSHHENYLSWTNQTCRTLLEKQGRAHK